MTRRAWQRWLRRGFLAWSQRLRSIEVERCSARSIGKSRNKMCPRLQLQPGGLMAAGLFFVLGGCHSATAFELQERIGPIGVESVVPRRRALSAMIWRLQADPLRWQQHKMVE